MADSYTTDNRVERIVSAQPVPYDEDDDGLFSTHYHNHGLGYSPYFRWYTDYPEGGVVIGSPYFYYPSSSGYFLVQVACTTTDIEYFIENGTTSGEGTIYSRVYTEEAV